MKASSRFALVLIRAGGDWGQGAGESDNQRQDLLATARNLGRQRLLQPERPAGTFRLGKRDKRRGLAHRMALGNRPGIARRAVAF